jgi:hypothetical protein
MEELTITNVFSQKNIMEICNKKMSIFNNPNHFQFATSATLKYDWTENFAASPVAAALTLRHTTGFFAEILKEQNRLTVDNFFSFGCCHQRRHHIKHKTNTVHS